MKREGQVNRIPVQELLLNALTEEVSMVYIWVYSWVDILVNLLNHGLESIIIWSSFALQ